MTTTTVTRKIVATLIGTVAALGIYAQAASASTVSASFGHTTATWNSSYNKASGTVYDDASDGACVRVYAKGYNYVLGWGDAQYRAQACGVGDHTNWSESPTVYSDHYKVQVCKGMPNSSRSNCSAWVQIH